MRVNENWVKCYTPEEAEIIFKKKVNEEAEKLKEYFEENKKEFAKYV